MEKGRHGEGGRLARVHRRCYLRFDAIVRELSEPSPRTTLVVRVIIRVIATPNH